MNESRTLHIAAVVVGHNHGAWLETALRSLTTSQVVDRQLTVYYVDNNSTDNSAQLVERRHPSVRLIRSDANLGFAKANNQAIRRAITEGAEHVFLVNPDTFSPPLLIEKLAQWIDTHSQYGAIGPIQWYFELGQLEVPPKPNQWTTEALLSGERHALWRNLPSLPSHSPAAGKAENVVHHSYLQGAAFYARSMALIEVDLLDETYHSYYEDVDLCRRFRLAGWEVALLPWLGIYHHGGSGGQSTYRRRHMMRNKYFYLFSDVQIRSVDMARVAIGWLSADISGHGLGGYSSRRTAMIDLFLTTRWLLGSLPALFRSRRHQRRLMRQSRGRYLARDAMSADR